MSLSEKGHKVTWSFKVDLRDPINFNEMAYLIPYQW